MDNFDFLRSNSNSSSENLNSFDLNNFNNENYCCGSLDNTVPDFLNDLPNSDDSVDMYLNNSFRWSNNSDPNELEGILKEMETNKNQNNFNNGNEFNNNPYEDTFLSSLHLGLPQNQNQKPPSVQITLHYR